MKIVLCGPKGIGKSTLGKKIASALGLVFVDLDEKVTSDICEYDVIKKYYNEENILISSRWKTVLYDNNIDFFMEKFFIVLLKADPGILWSRLKYRKSFLDMSEDISFDYFCSKINDVYESIEDKSDLIYSLKPYRKSGTHREISDLILNEYYEKQM